MAAFLAQFAITCAILLAGISLILLVVASFSYARLKGARLLAIAVAFALSLVQGILLIRLAYTERGAIADGAASIPLLAAVSLAMVMAIYLAVLKR